MTQDEVNIIIPLLVFPFMVYLFTLLIISEYRYSKLLDNIEKLEPKLLKKIEGNWFERHVQWIRFPSPIILTPENKKIQPFIELYNKTISLFWKSIIIVTPIILILAFIFEQ